MNYTKKRDVLEGKVQDVKGGMISFQNHECFPPCPLLSSRGRVRPPVPPLVTYLFATGSPKAQKKLHSASRTFSRGGF